ncbi:MAG: diguanylate cyclase [Lachnospiraceae bacterium]|nr:diguanylate cyclase [Lachnospiraceae bacterium]
MRDRLSAINRFSIIAAIAAGVTVTAALLLFFLIWGPEAGATPMSGNEAKLAVLTFILISGMLILVYSVIGIFGGQGSGEAVLICAAVILFAVNALGASGLLPLFMKNAAAGEVAAKFAGYAAPAVLMVFWAVSTDPKKKVRKRIYTVLAGVVVAVCAAAYASGKVSGLPQTDFGKYAPFVTVGVLFLVIIVERGALIQSSAENAEDVLTRTGIRIAAVCAAADMLIKNAERFPAISAGLEALGSAVDFRTVGICALSAFLLLYEWKKMGRFRSSAEREELMERLAYTDILCGVPNRHYCDRKIADISRHKGYQASLAEYTIFMMDVDDLAKVNAEHGFDAGDELIRCVGDAVADAMRGCGADEFGIRSPQPSKKDADENANDCFYGLWGSDEFVACTYRSQADAFETTLTSRIAAINIEKRLPFQVSVSVGSCDFRSGSYDRIARALALADRAMLERKARYHEVHG